MPGPDPLRKIMSRDAALAWRRAQRGNVVFTNGVFDILHRGHVQLLAAARTEGDALVVGLNSDGSVRRLGKGKDRPINTESDRAAVLAALECVDCVVLFDEDTPLDIISALRPDVLAKGADYSPDAVVGADAVAGWGGRVVRVPLAPGYSTTALIARMQRDQT